MTASGSDGLTARTHHHYHADERKTDKGENAMTFCKVLAQKKVDDDTITAYELIDKYDAVPRYEIVISKDEIARLVIKTAKTTWKRKFNELGK